MPTVTTDALVHHLALLTPAESADVCREVHALREHWRPRHPTQPFFTLGAASYLDARDDAFEAYQVDAQRMNRLLGERFGGLLERFRLAVAARVGAEAVYDARLALPGFHIFLFDPAFRHSGAKVHYDLQYELIDWSGFGTPDTDAQLSLTLSVALPAAGGGLLVWNLNRRDLDRMPPEARVAHSRANRFARFEPYELGGIAVHSGHQLHQIGPSPNLQPGDERITLQAHALPVGGRWIIYW